MKKITFYLIILLLCSSTFAQNSYYIFGSNGISSSYITQPLPIPQDYFGQTINLPNQDPTLGYIGQLPTNTSNIQMDASGEILFFIVDDFVYDKNGYFIDQLQVNVNGQYAKGASEICIIPNAFHCGRYYIITTHIDGNKKTPVIFEIDMTVPNIHDLNNTCEYYGALIGSDGTSNSYNDNPVGFTGEHVSGDIYEPFFPEDIEPSKQSGVFFGATKLRNDNTRLFFVTNGHGLHSYVLNQSGFQHISYEDFNEGVFNPSQVRSELEVVLLPNGNYRIAAPYLTNGNGQLNSEGIFTAEYSQNGVIIPNTIRKFTVFTESGNSFLNSRFKGVEFSKDGRFLYVTHTTNTLEPDAFEYFDFQNPTSDLIPINLPNGIDFQYSFLELSFNN